jgi:starch synthase
VKILFVASECAPFAKAGGLGDVVGALPKALEELGHDVRILIPRYGFIDTAPFCRYEAPLGVPLGYRDAWCGILEGRLPGSNVPVYFLEHDALYAGNAIYSSYGHSEHEFARFALLSRGAFQWCRALKWVPDVMHVHDWPTAFVPALLNAVEARAPFEKTASVLTIHNLAHQPRFHRGLLSLLELPEWVFRQDGFEDYGEVNPLKGGLYHATKLSTVSQTYAKEIRGPVGGAGLHRLMDFRGADLVGIPNGIDVDIWDPRHDPAIASAFSSGDLSGKRVCKAELQKELGFEVRADVPLIGMVSRWTFQKGIDLVTAMLDQILSRGVQLVILGSGERNLEDELLWRSRSGGGRFSAWVGYNERLAHRIEAGADLFLMPSRFEPCGLNQMYSQRYGTLPIVRATGGLVDTVDPYSPETGEGTGFLFEPIDGWAMLAAIDQALSVYREHPQRFIAMQKRAMQRDFGWESAARSYVELYRGAVNAKG